MLMKGGGKQSQGFTIVETMIVLAITGLLILGAIFLVAGRQNDTEFVTAIQDVQSQLQQQINQVSSGFYSTLGNLNCSATTAPVGTPEANINIPSISIGSNGRGTNQDCIFMGTFFHFYSAQNATWGNQYSTYPVVGRQCQTGSTTGSASNPANPPCTIPTSIPNALPVVVAPGQNYGSGRNYTAIPYDVTNFTYDNGITVAAMCYQYANCTPSTQFTTTHTTINGVSKLHYVRLCSFGVISNPAETSGTYTNSLISGSTSLSLWAANSNQCFQQDDSIDNPNTESIPNDLMDVSLDYNYTTGTLNPTNNPISDVEICFDSGTTNQSAMLTIKSTDETSGTTTTTDSQQEGANGITTSLEFYGDSGSNACT